MAKKALPKKAARPGKKAAKAPRAAKKGMVKAGRAALKPATNGVVYLSGGNPQIAMGDGDAPVQAYLAALHGWKKDVARRLDAIVVEVVPDGAKAVKWNSPLYGVGDGSYFLSLHMYANFVRVTFFRGRSLKPVPPGESTQKEVRYLDIRDPGAAGGGFDEMQLAKWVHQAATQPGWKP